MIVTMAGQKGGSGKTTTAICLADEWYRRGRDVLLVDTDPQSTALTWGNAASEEDDGPTVISMGDDFHEELPELTDGYDHVVVDCPPGNSERQRSGLMVADLALIPCGAGITDVWSMAETLELASTARAIRPSLQVALLITRRDARTVIGDEVRKELEKIEYPILNAELGDRVAYREMPSAGVGVTRYKPNGKAADEVRDLVNEIEHTEDASE
jgi:chromosome partitioning protein